MEHNLIRPRTYFLVYIALLVLLAATIGASFLKLGTLNFLVALFIAAIKAALVILFFMQVKNAGSATRVFVLVGFLWLGILVFLSYADYLSRPFLPFW